MANPKSATGAKPAVAPAAGAAAGTTNTGIENGVAAGVEAAEKKPRPERVFTGALNFQKQRQAESKVTGEFNRLARKLKGMGLSEEGVSSILEVLKGEYPAMVKKAVDAVQSEDESEGSETFV